MKPSLKKDYMCIPYHPLLPILSQILLQPYSDLPLRE